MRIVALLLIALASLTGCQENTAKPEVVAGNFMSLVAQNRYDDAMAYVYPEDRQYFSQNLQKELKAFSAVPNDPEVLVETSGKNGEFIVNNWDPRAKIQMLNKYGRWWIKK